MARGPEQTFSQEDIGVANTLNITREKQLKPAMRDHLTPVIVTIINKMGNDKCWRGCGEKGTPMLCWRPAVRSPHPTLQHLTS